MQEATVMGQSGRQQARRSTGGGYADARRFSRGVQADSVMGILPPDLTPWDARARRDDRLRTDPCPTLPEAQEENAMT